MLSVNDLTDALGLSDSAVRRRIKALDGIIDDHIKRGDKSKLLVDSSGLELLKTLEDLRKQGKTIDEAVQHIREETGKSENNNLTDTLPKPTGKQREGPDREELLREQIDQLKGRVEYLKNQVEKKDQMLEEKEDQIRRLLPGKVEEHSGKEDKNPYEGKSLWEVIREWLKAPAR
ncbi:MAG: hypothetical protein V5A79_07175 [Candidatus Bipolaricaulota bacterium]